jgi:hypothetical protein
MPNEVSDGNNAKTIRTRTRIFKFHTVNYISIEHYFKAHFDIIPAIAELFLSLVVLNPYSRYRLASKSGTNYRLSPTDIWFQRNGWLNGEGDRQH